MSPLNRLNLSSSLLNKGDTVMTILMFQSANADNSGLIVLLIMGEIFLSLECLVIFYWVANIMNFTLLDAGYFCNPINILELFLRCI